MPFYKVFKQPCTLPVYRDVIEILPNTKNTTIEEVIVKEEDIEDKAPKFLDIEYNEALKQGIIPDDKIVPTVKSWKIKPLIPKVSKELPKKPPPKSKPEPIVIKTDVPNYIVKK